MADQTFPLFPPNEVQAVKKAVIPTGWLYLTPEKQLQQIGSASPSFKKWPTQQQKAFVDAVTARYQKRGVLGPPPPKDTAKPAPTPWQQVEEKAKEAFEGIKPVLGFGGAAPAPSPTGQPLYDQTVAKADEENRQFHEKQSAVPAQPKAAPELVTGTPSQVLAHAKGAFIPLSGEALQGRLYSLLKPEEIAEVEKALRIDPETAEQMKQQFGTGEAPQPIEGDPYGSLVGISGAVENAGGPEVFARAALESLSQWYSPAMMAVGVMGKASGAATKATGELGQNSYRFAREAQAAWQAAEKAENPEAAKVLVEKGNKLVEQAYAAAKGYENARKFAAAVRTANAAVGASFSVAQASQAVDLFRQGKWEEGLSAAGGAVAIGFLTALGAYGIPKLMESKFGPMKMPPKVEYTPPREKIAAEAPKPTEGGTEAPPTPSAPRLTPTEPPATGLIVPTDRPHLENAVDSPTGENWGTYLLRPEVKQVATEAGIDHYQEGNTHYIVVNGEVQKRTGSAGVKLYNAMVKAAKLRTAAEPPEPVAPKGVPPQASGESPTTGGTIPAPPPASGEAPTPTERRGKGRQDVTKMVKSELQTLVSTLTNRKFGTESLTPREERLLAEGKAELDNRHAAEPPFVPAPEGSTRPGAPEPSAVPAPEPGLFAPTPLAGITSNPTDPTNVVVVNTPAFVESLKAGAPLPKGTIAIPTKDLALVPEEMQFRSDEGKLTRAIARGTIDIWKPGFAGALNVWFDQKDGRIKVVNGHFRMESAQRLGVDWMKADFLPYEEAATVQEARAWGALKNIAENTSDAFDAAVYFREKGFSPGVIAKTGLSAEGSIVKDGISLSNLSPELFEKVRIGKDKGGMTQRVGIAIGAALESHDAQRDLYKLVQDREKRGKRLSSEEILALAERRIKGAGETVTTTQNLFGEEVMKQSHAIEAAQLEVAIKKQLGTDKRLFGYLSKESRAKALERGSNVIAVGENQKISQQAKEILDVFNKLLYKSGPVDDAIMEGAARIARGEDFDAVQRNTYERISEAVKKAITGGAGADVPVSEGVAGKGPGGQPEQPALPEQPAAAPPDSGGGPPDVALPGGQPGGHGTGDGVAAQPGVAEQPAPGGQGSLGGVVPEAPAGGDEAGLAPPIPSAAQPVNGPKYGDRNKSVSTNRAEQARERLRKKLNRPAIGIDPEMIADVSALALYHFEAGVRSFVEWSGKMKDELGDDIDKPILDRLWSFVSHRIATAEALANTKAATIHVPLDQREPLREASEWSLSLDESNIESTAPAPKVKMSEENAKKLVYQGQRELAELALSALTNPGAERPGFVLAAATGTGKSYIGSAIISELKPQSALILTTNQGLIDKAIAVGREFNLDIQRIPPVKKGIPPQGLFIATYMGAIGYPGIENQPWNMVVADESDSGRKWWSSESGKMLRKLSGTADKTLFMSATPFHTPVEMAYADNLGVWKKGDFVNWVSQFGVYQDENGNWIAPSNPKRFAKLRLQMTDAGVFVNLTPTLDGYTASFGVVPIAPEQRVEIGNIKKAFDAASLYFLNRHRAAHARACKACYVTYTKSYLERIRLPQAVEIAKQARAKGWSVGIFTETRSASETIYPFLQEADDALKGRIRALLPPLPDVIKTLRDAFGADFANFSGSYSEMRQDELEAFNKGEKPVLASTYAAGGRGVDMNDKSGVRPRLAIYLGPPWSGVMFDQAMGRFWRFGTKSDVFAVFLTSDSKAEFSLVHGKVVPRLASLRALVKGVHDDKFTKAFQNIEGALSYSQGEGDAFDADDFVVKVESNSVNHWDKIEIPDAVTAHNKGLVIARTDEAPATAEPGFGKGNTIFTEAKKDAADENLTDHMGELRGGIDPSMIKDLFYIGGFYAEGGIREFGKWQQAMLGRFGEGVRKYLPELWKEIQDKVPKKKRVAKPKEDMPLLPGFGPVVAEEKAAAGAEQGRQLTERFNQGPKSIDVGAGKIEQSPLFKGTAAAPQTEMFGAAPAPEPVASESAVPAQGEAEPAPEPVGESESPPAPHTMPETRDSLAAYKELEAKIQGGEGNADMVLVAAARAKGAGLRKEAFVLAMKRAKVASQFIDRAVKATWEGGHTDTTDEALRWDTRRRGLHSSFMGLDEVARLAQSIYEKVTKKGEAPRPGPGGKTAGPIEQEGTPTEQLTGAIKAAHKGVKPELPYTGMPDPPKVEGESPLSGVIRGVSDIVQDAWKHYSQAAPSGDYMDIVGHFDGTLRRNTFSLQKLDKAARKANPDETRLKAMSDWLWAEGDDATLRGRASLSKGDLKKGYEVATQLTDAEKTDTRNIQNAFESYFDVGHEAGVIEGHLENYIPQIWKSDRTAARIIMAQITGGILRKDFKFAKHRTINGYFEGEQQGKTPLNKDLLFLYTTYVRSLIKAIEGRAFVRNLLFNYAPDGKPLAVVAGGKYEVVTKAGKRVLVANPNIAPQAAVDEEGNRYRSIDHPALREGLYIGKDAKGLPMYLQAPIVVHPSIYNHLKNVLDSSKFRESGAEWYWQLGGKAIDYTNFIKNSKIVPFSPFHQVHLAKRALAFWTNPFNVPEFNVADPHVIEMTDGGMTIAEPDVAIRSEEGLIAGGIWDVLGKKWPAFGRAQRNHQYYLFNDYRERLKVDASRKLLPWNLKLYDGKKTRKETVRLTAAQLNDAFGGQNVVMLGNNKTWLDVHRLLLFSPDFTKGTMKSIFGVFSPWWKSRLAVLLSDAAQLLVAALFIGKLLKTVTDGYIDWVPPFGIRVGKNEYSTRSLSTDAWRMIQDPKTFARNRLSPALAAPAWEEISKTDSRGMPRTFKERVEDTLYGYAPIGSEGLTEPGRHLWQSVFNALGIQSKKFYTPAGRLALQIHQQDMAAKSRRHETPEDVESRQEVAKLFQQLNDGDPIPTEKVDGMLQQGAISPYTAMRLKEAKPGEDPMLGLFASLEIQDKLDVWDKATPEERGKLINELALTVRDMRELRAMPANDSDRVLDRFEAARNKKIEEPAPDPTTAEPGVAPPPNMLDAPQQAPEPTIY